MFVLNIELLMRAISAPLLSLVLTLAPAKTDTSIKVTANEARIVRLARSADTVIVGNPAIADATVQDEKTIVLTGKEFGVTNLIILDRDGTQIVDTKIFVASNKEKTMRVYTESSVQTFLCSPSCEGSIASASLQKPGQAASSKSP